MQPCELRWKTHERRNDPEIMKYRATITCCPIQLGSISSLRCQKSRSLLSIRTSKCEVMFRGRRYEQSVIKPSGGARRDRTDDLMLAKHALSQLSYGPVTRRRMLGSWRPSSLHSASQTRVNALLELRRGSLHSSPGSPSRSWRSQRRLVGLGRLELPTSRL